MTRSLTWMVLTVPCISAAQAAVPAVKATASASAAATSARFMVILLKEVDRLTACIAKVHRLCHAPEIGKRAEHHAGHSIVRAQARKIRR